MANDDSDERREAIRALIKGREIATQEELRERLDRQGYEVTQATLSRDLARLGARRVSRPEGGTTYELPERVNLIPSEERLTEIGAMVAGVTHNGTLVVLHTSPGAASAVALWIDTARLNGVLGTIAGDDTIFLAPAKNHSAAKLTQKLEKLFQKG